MSQLINSKAVEELIKRTLEEDMNESLDKIVTEVTDRLKATVHANVAARMIALAQSDYSVEYMRHELRIVVKMETN
tara:strand:- start:3694 stop:3921 length:228 start_codon:yes stop_codon:yes gene_type:complete